MTDIPLIDANILWTPANATGRFPALRGTLAVEHRSESAETTLYSKHRVKVGACLMWKRFTADERMLELMRYVQMMTVRDGLSPRAVHEGLAVIPEYRRSMSRWVEEWQDEFAEFEQ
ncbi:hypothetical protein [Sphingomonas sp. PB4P5]|uniref:hypothetical protein n=1 Tax=Parasphingomonas puruogangriensis TaxID=3096155 RepID=UPI002FC96399